MAKIIKNDNSEMHRVKEVVDTHDGYVRVVDVDGDSHVISKSEIKRIDAPVTDAGQKTK